MYFSTVCFPECIFPKYIFPENILSKCILPKCIFPKCIFQSEFFQCVFSKVFFWKNVHDSRVFFALQVYFQLVNIDVREGIKTYSYTLLHFSLTCYLDLHNMTKGRECEILMKHKSVIEVGHEQEIKEPGEFYWSEEKKAKVRKQNHILR